MKTTFTIPLTRPQFEAARYRLVTQHFVTADTDTDHGRLAARGVTLDYAFDGASIAITIEHKPELYPEGAVEAKIRAFFTDSPASHRDPLSRT